MAKFNVVFFLDTTGQVLDENQKKAFQAFIVNGGGYVGTHSAADTLRDWDFYGKLVGTWQKNHGGYNPAKVKVENKTHPTTRFLARHYRLVR